MTSRRKKKLKRRKKIKSARNKASEVRRTELPKHVLDLFWEYPKRSISWERYADLVTRKILMFGTEDSVRWLRSTVGDLYLKTWILRHHGRGLDRSKMKFWEKVLNLPKHDIVTWTKNLKLNPWNRRLHQ